MYDRYSDISKFITDPDRLEIADDGYVCISGENDYDIAVDLNSCYGSFDEVKPYIVFIAEHINELDNTVQRFDNKQYGFSGLRETMYFLNWIGIPKPNFVTLEYICTDVNSEFNVLFEYKNKLFYLREFGMEKNIPDDWEHPENRGRIMDHLNLQPLRIPPNWTMMLNKFENIEPETLPPEDETWLSAFNEDIIYLESKITRERNKQTEEQKLVIDLGWYPDGDPDGNFVLQAVLNEDWNDPLMKFSSRNKDEIVKTLEKWLWKDFMPLRFIDEEYFHKKHKIKYT